MVFPETVLFDFILLQLEEEMATFAAPDPDPMLCDRWIARSCLQKAIRRGETLVAQRALANLLEHDRYGVWRHLTVIALEDVGVAGMDVLTQVVAAGRNRPWRRSLGGDWAVASFLVHKLAEGMHCQAACDLLLRVTNCPTLEVARAAALDAEPADLVNQLSEANSTLENRALAALALGGGLADEQRHRDAVSVFNVVARDGQSSRVVATAEAAWRTSRNPMALLLPLVWQRWTLAGNIAVRDDEVISHNVIDGVPGYAIDQFTRVGGQVARAYLAQDQSMPALLDQASIPRSQQPRALGDLIFLMEGSCLAGRAIWPTAEALRHPYRALPYAIRLGRLLDQALSLLDTSRPVLANLRAVILSPEFDNRTLQGRPIAI